MEDDDILARLGPPRPGGLQLLAVTYPPDNDYDCCGAYDRGDAAGADEKGSSLHRRVKVEKPNDQVLDVDGS